jgi:hypothetical protein
MDFGVYDLRTPNEISKNSAWAAVHQQYKAQEWYGICWFDMLPTADASRVKSLSAGDQKRGKVSDYCQTDAGNTLSANGGKPV